MANEFGPNVLPFPQLQGTVPSSAAAGPDVSSLIGHISDPLTPELIRQATTPIAGPRVPQLPSSMTRPIAPYQQTPFDTREVVGAGNARARGIANAFTGVTNALGTVVTAEAQKKQGEIRDAATKVITAQQAIDEAQQQHDMAIQQGDADTASKMMELIKENQKVRDGVFADPKMRKALAKGFDISYTDPSQNKTEEHQAVMQALQGAKTRAEKQAAIAKLRAEQNAKAGAAAGSAFAAAQPRGLAPNVMAQQKVQLALQQQAVQEKMYKDMMTYMASMARANAPVEAAKVRELGESYRDSIKNMQNQIKMQDQFAYKLKYLDAQTAAREHLLWEGLNIADRKEMDRLTMMSRDPLTITKMANESDKTWQSNIEAIQGRLTSATNQLQTLRGLPNNTPGKASEVAQLQAQVDATKLTLQQAQNKQAYWGGVMATYKKMAGLPDEPQEGGANATDPNTGIGQHNANSIRSYTGSGDAATNLINEINSGSLNFNLPQ